MFILANVLVLSVSIFYSALLRLKTKFSFIMSIYLISFSILVLSFELASLVHQINKFGVIVIQFFFGILGGLLWFFNGRPSLLGPFKNSSFDSLKKEFQSVLSLIVASKDLFILFCFLCITFGINLLISIAIRPMNFDILAYHLPRIIYWSQNQSFLPWTTFDLRQTTSPPNGEIALLWIFLWTKSDAFLWLVQFISFFFSMIVVARLAQMLGYRLKSIIFVTLIWSSLGQVFFQAFSLQNDMVITGVAVCMVSLFFDGIRYGNKGAIILSAVAFGLALGTKLTFLFLLPGWGILIVFLFWKRPDHRRSVSIWIGASLIAFVLFGVYFYIQNYLYYGGFFGTPESVDIVSGRNNAFFRLELLRDNLGRYLYQSIEFSPLPDVVRIPLVDIKNLIFSRLYDAIGIQVTSTRTVLDKLFEFEVFKTYVFPGLPEDTSWFGPLFILFIPILLKRTLRAVRLREFLQLSLIFIFFFYFVTQATLQPWTYYKSRYFIAPVTLVFPFFADIYTHETKNRLVRVSQYCIVIIAIASLLLNSLVHPYRNVSGFAYLLRGERMPPIWYRLPIYLSVDKHVPDDEILGTYYSDFLSRFVNHEEEEKYPLAGDYPLFGLSFDRRVVPLDNIEHIPDNINYLFIASYYADNSKSIQSNFILLDENNNMSLYMRENMPSLQNP